MTIRIDPPLAPHHLAYLRRFSEVEHVRRNSILVEDVPDPLRESCRLPIGWWGSYYTGDDPHPESVINENGAGLGQPDQRCPWSPNEDGTEIVWMGGNSDNAADWLDYLRVHFLRLWHYNISGEIEVEGDESVFGTTITVTNSQVKEAIA